MANVLVEVQNLWVRWLITVQLEVLAEGLASVDHKEELELVIIVYVCVVSVIVQFPLQDWAIKQLSHVVDLD